MLDNGQEISGLNMNYRRYVYSPPALAATVVTIVIDPNYLFPHKAGKISDYSLKQNNDVLNQVSIKRIQEHGPHKLKCLINIPACSKGRIIKNNTPSRTYNSFPNKGPFLFNGKNQSLGTPTANDERRNLTYGTDFYIGMRTGSSNTGNYYLLFDGVTPYVRNAGTHFVNFIGKGNYTGTDYVTVTVNQASISNTGSGTNYKGHLALNISSIVYDRANHTPTVSAYDDSNAYTIDKEDFSINVVSGTNAGTYTSTATSKGRNYTSGSTLSGSFTITQKPISDSNVTVTSQSASLE
ncbi:MAG: hypothetical protein MJ246_02195 [Clostridia bacterium]|nr:hypothetical protein [Clostridia bacterium]